jgi:LysM repeat protein
MRTKYKTLLLLPILMAMILAGCNRSASTAPVTVPGTPEINPTELPVDRQILSSTATAQSVIKDFNQPTQIIINAQGTSVAITQPPATPTPAGTATPTPLPPTPVMTRPVTWAVQGGETVYCLARRFDVDPGEMLELNNLYAGSMLSIGDVLQVPQSGSWPTEDRMILEHPDTWTVSAGETVYSIACEYGDVWPEQIIAVNGLQAPYELEPGQVLQIP